MKIAIADVSRNRKEKFRIFFKNCCYLIDNFSHFVWINHKIINKWSGMFVTDFMTKQIKTLSSDKPISFFLIVNSNTRLWVKIFQFFSNSRDFLFKFIKIITSKINLQNKFW